MIAVDNFPVFFLQGNIDFGKKSAISVKKSSQTVV